MFPHMFNSIPYFTYPHTMCSYHALFKYPFFDPFCPCHFWLVLLPKHIPEQEKDILITNIDFLALTFLSLQESVQS